MNVKSTILIVDDEAYGRETLEDLLVTQGYNLAFASNGAECLKKASQLTPDVILLDVMMPEMNGYEVCRRLRTDPLLAEVPIIMLTALDDRDSRLEGIEAGADDFISKPFNRVELRARLRTITRLNRYRRLLSERARFKWVVDQAEDGYLMLDSELKLNYANSQARRYLNLPPDDTLPLNQSFQQLVEGHYDLKPKEIWASWPEPAPDVEPAVRYLVRPETNVTDMFWLKVDTLDMMFEAGEGYLVRLQDVTATIAEDRFRWTFQAQVSHKLKTPLTQLIGGLELLVDGHAKLSEERKNSLLSMIYKGSTQLQNAMHGIFQYVEAPDIVRPGRGRISLSEVEQTISNISKALALETIKIDFAGFDDLDTTYVAISSRAIEMILSELLENARKFHPQQAPMLEISFAAVPAGVQIQISDDGVTLAPEQLEQMWYPYHQVEKYFTGQVPGMGLGLSVVAALIWGVGGTYQAHNREDGPGVVVEMILPLKD